MKTVLICLSVEGLTCSTLGHHHHRKAGHSPCGGEGGGGRVGLINMGGVDISSGLLISEMALSSLGPWLFTELRMSSDQTETDEL